MITHLLGWIFLKEKVTTIIQQFCELPRSKTNFLATVFSVSGNLAFMRARKMSRNGRGPQRTTELSPKFLGKSFIAMMVSTYVLWLMGSGTSTRFPWLVTMDFPQAYFLCITEEDLFQILLVTLTLRTDTLYEYLLTLVSISDRPTSAAISMRSMSFGFLHSLKRSSNFLCWSRLTFGRIWGGDRRASTAGWLVVPGDSDRDSDDMAQHLPLQRLAIRGHSSVSAENSTVFLANVKGACADVRCSFQRSLQRNTVLDKRLRSNLLTEARYTSVVLPTNLWGQSFSNFVPYCTCAAITECMVFSHMAILETGGGTPFCPDEQILKICQHLFPSTAVPSASIEKASICFCESLKSDSLHFSDDSVRRGYHFCKVKTILVQRDVGWLCLR